MNSTYIRLRSIARRTGLIRLINLFRLHPGQAYEEQFHNFLREAIRPGDVVWDVGANVGHYTELFCSWVAPGGHVVAFEPGRESFEKIKQRIPDSPSLHLENIALGDADTTGLLTITENSVDRGLLTAASDDVPAEMVTVSRGDSVCARLGRVPNIIKIDVEGFEEEVLIGLKHTLSAPELRSLLMEIHFQKLEARGQQLAPVRIEKILRDNGFDVKWIGLSNLQATRKAA